MLSRIRLFWGALCGSPLLTKPCLHAFPCSIPAFEMDSGIQTGYLSSIQDHIKAFLERIIVRKSNGSTDFNYVQHTTSSPGQAEKWQRQCQPAVTNPTYRFFGWLFKKNMYI